jgi:hypothetical protein
VTALSREKAGIKGKMGKEDTQREFEGARVVFGDVTDTASISAAAFDQPADVVVCCLASRTGARRQQAVKGRRRGGCRAIVPQPLCGEGSSWRGWAVAPPPADRACLRTLSTAR